MTKAYTLVILAVMTATACWADDRAAELDLSTPKSVLLAFTDAVGRKDWRAAEQCLAADLRITLKESIADRSFFDQFVVDGFNGKELGLIPVRYTTAAGVAGLSQEPPGGLPRRFTAQVGKGDGATPWVAQCAFVQDEDGWKLTSDRIKRPEDFDSWYERAIPKIARGTARQVE